MIYEFTAPTEETRYRLFDEKFEDNPLVLFHTTPIKNVQSIIKSGFRFGPSLKSVSYAFKSSSCLSHRGKVQNEDFAVFVVEFESLDSKGIKINSSDIHVFDEQIQPKIIGYCVIPKEYQHS